MRADLGNTPWYNTGTMNDLYVQFPATVGSYHIEYTGEYAFPPDNAVKIVLRNNSPAYELVTATQYNAGTLVPAGPVQSIHYDVPEQIKAQIDDLTDQSNWVYAQLASFLYDDDCVGCPTDCTVCVSCDPVAQGIPPGPNNLICPYNPDGIRFVTPSNGPNYPVLCTYKLPATEYPSSIKTVNLRSGN